MSTTPKISGYFIGATVAGLLAAGVFDGPSAPVPASQVPRNAQAIVDAAFSTVATTHVDRARKSDRLPVLRVAPVTLTTIIPKNAGSSDLTVRRANGTPAPHTIIDVGHGKPAPRPAPVPLADCETVASPIADPTLSRIVGRCFV